MLDLQKIYKRGHHWLGEVPKEDSYFGFLYTVINLKTKRIYIGRKNYKAIRTRRGGEPFVTKGKWEFYTTSSKPLNEDIKKIGKEYFLFAIISQHNSQEELNMAEVDLLNTMKVLGSELFYNRAIGNIRFETPIVFSEETKKKMSERRKGENNGMYGKRHTEEAKRRTGEASRLRGISETTRQKITATRLGNEKFFVFIKKDNTRLFGTKQDFIRIHNLKTTGTLDDLIRGKARCHDCLSGFSKVNSRYGFIKAIYLGKNKDKEELIEKYSNSELDI